MKPKIKLREDFRRGQVRVIVDGVEKHRSGEYRLAAEYVVNVYHLSSAEMMAVWRDYKSDYDLQRDRGTEDF